MSPPDPQVGMFGFNPSDGHHHYLVNVPSAEAGDQEVTVYECLRFLENYDGTLPTGAIERVQFLRPVWDAISEQVRVSFNLRLKEANRKLGKWRPGHNYLSPHYGKELVLLGWALEDLPSDRADTVFRNWRGLAPEERWWLYSTANAPFSQNSRKGRGLGWRKALTVALSENPLVDVPGETGRATLKPGLSQTSTDSEMKSPAKKAAAKKKTLCTH